MRMLTVIVNTFFLSSKLKRNECEMYDLKRRNEKKKTQNEKKRPTRRTYLL